MNPLSPTPGNKPSHLKESINSGCDYLKQESAHCISAISDFARTRLGKVLQILLVLGVITEASYLTTRKDTSEIEMQHDGYQFSLEDMPLREKLSQLMVGSPYDSRTSNFLDNAFSKTPILSSNFIDWASDWLKTDENTGGVHIFGSDAGDPEEANRTIVELMAKSKIPPLPSMDVVGGYTRHLGLTPADVEKYGVPEKFMKLAKDKNLALPTQEDIGRAFLELKTVKERIAFRKEMEDYGKAIGDLCRDLGIAVNFAPVLDTVDDIDGDNFMEYNDQAYGEEPYVVQLLGFHFVKGLNSVDGVMSSPKHFFGTGKSPNDPHHNEKQQITETTKRDGSVLPFKDVIQGRLLYDKIIRRYEHDTKSFDYYLRRHLGKIRRSKSGRSTRRLNQARKDYRAFLKTHDLTVRDVPEDFMEMPKIQGIMVSHSQNFTNPDTPGTISSEMIKRRLQQNLGFHGIVFTDDLNMGATENFVNGRASEVDNWPAEAFASSLAAGSTMPMLLHHSGEIDAIVERVQRAIDDKEDFDGDGKADITIDIINEAVRLVLETKADAGLLKKSRSSRSRSMFSGKKRPQRTVYENNSREYLRKTIGRR